MEHTLVAVDLAKLWFEVALSKEPGKVSKQLRLKGDRVLEYFAQLPPATVVMEACGSAHYWALELEKLGHRVVLLAAQHVRPYVLRDKTDRTDTRGLLEAYRNEAIRPKSIRLIDAFDAKLVEGTPPSLPTSRPSGAPSGASTGQRRAPGHGHGRGWAPGAVGQARCAGVARGSASPDSVAGRKAR